MKKEYLRDGRAPIPQSEAISRVMSANKGKNTKPELLLRKALWNEHIRGYRLHWKQVPGRPDIAFVSKKLAVFVNGCYWHRCPYCHLHEPKTNSDFWKKKFEANVARDRKKTETLQTQGWQVLTIWECEIKKNIDACVEQIRQAI
jgi:DNA mismatch endonuclease, patch repair protein